MKIGWKRNIKETEEELLDIEKKQKNPRIRDRIKMLRLLKTGKYTLLDAAQILGISYTTARLNWRRYKEGGISKLMEWRYKGRKPRVDYNKLRKGIDWERNAPATLADSARIIEQKFGAKYTVKGVWYLFRVNGIKLKTGRPVNPKKDPHKAQEFKKNSRR